MKYPKFTLIEDWFIETEFLGIKNKQLIYKKGHTFESNQKGEYHIIYGGWTEENSSIGGRMILNDDEMRKANDNGKIIFSEVKENKEEFEIIIEEIPDDDDNLVRNWRIQLDVKTTKKKLKEVQRIIEEQVKPILK